jgi:hypothetical protein
MDDMVYQTLDFEEFTEINKYILDTKVSTPKLCQMATILFEGALQNTSIDERERLFLQFINKMEETYLDNLYVERIDDE